MRTRAVVLPPSLLALAALAAACTAGEEPEKGVPITGTLNSASGPAAPLTILPPDDAPSGEGFTLSAELDGVDVSGTSTWRCFAPLPPDYPNFDIEATDGETFGLFISISPLVWATGGIAIDGEDVELLVAAPDRFGVATSGTIFLTSAPETPDSSGQNCGFSVGSLALEGERDG